MTNQDDIIKFVQDKDNIAKAVEGSMEKRAKVLTNQDMNTWVDELFDEYYPVGTVVPRDTAEDEKAALMTMVLEHRRNLFKALILAKFNTAVAEAEKKLAEQTKESNDDQARI